jgi:hypothetical protein
VGNALFHGRDTYTDLPLVGYHGVAYLNDNFVFNDTGEEMLWGEYHGHITKLRRRPSWPWGYEAIPSSELVEDLLPRVGARPLDRDEVDQRLLEDFVEGRGRLIDSQEEVGGYPQVEPVYRVLDVPTEEVGEWLDQLSAELGGAVRTP